MVTVKEKKNIQISAADANFLVDMLEREINDAAYDVCFCNAETDYLVCCCDTFNTLRCEIAAHMEGGGEQ